MREAYSNSTFASKIKILMGGRVVKISDKATLGLPDSMHICNRITTFFETKLDDRIKAVSMFQNKMSCQPWDAVEGDIRQYEVCKRINRCANVLYVIYYPRAHMSAVIPLDVLEGYNRKRNTTCLYWLQQGPYFNHGYGEDLYERILVNSRKELYEKLRRECEGIPPEVRPPDLRETDE